MGDLKYSQHVHLAGSIRSKQTCSKHLRNMLALHVYFGPTARKEALAGKEEVEGKCISVQDSRGMVLLTGFLNGHACIIDLSALSQSQYFRSSN